MELTKEQRSQSASLVSVKKKATKSIGIQEVKMDSTNSGSGNESSKKDMSIKLEEFPTSDDEVSQSYLLEDPQQHQKELSADRGSISIQSENDENEKEISNEIFPFEDEQKILKIVNVDQGNSSEKMEIGSATSSPGKKIQKKSSFFKQWRDKDQKKKKEDDALVVETFEDLPKDLQKVVKGTKIPKELYSRHLEIILNILQFQCKVKFQSVEEKKRNMICPVNSPPPKTLDHRPIIDQDLLLSPENPKELYKTLKEEGKGGFGTVFKAVSKLEGEKDKIVAIKVMPHGNEKERKFNIAELSFLSFCKHPNIVKYYRSYKCDDELWAIMEYMEGGTLNQAVKNYSFQEGQVAYVAREMLRGIEYLHSENFVHRDLKSSNVMMTVKGQIKLIDFGLCVDISNGMKASMVGSPFWMPPEMIQRKPHDYKVDIWSLGICLMECANGHAPNSKNSTRAMFVAATEGYPDPFEKPKLWSKDFKDFLSLCLQMEPENRPTASQLLHHPWISTAESSKSMIKIISGIFILQAVLPF